MASLGNAGQRPGGKAEALAPQRIIRIGGTLVNEQCLSGLVFGEGGRATVAALTDMGTAHVRPESNPCCSDIGASEM
jgi:hypothetical protein